VLLRERRHPLNKLKAYGWVFAHWPQMVAARRHVQSIRRCSDRDLLAACTYRLSYEQTGDGPLAALAHAVFDALYRALFELALAVVRW
jgi:hypothetical protein